MMSSSKRGAFAMLFFFLATTLGAHAPRPVAPVGHTREVISVAFSPNGRYVLTGSGDQLDLKFSDRDASYFCKALRSAGQKLIGDKVFVTLLNIDAADNTRQDISIKATIQKAFADIASKAKAQDVLVIYFSGHGVNYGTSELAQFYYLKFILSRPRCSRRSNELTNKNRHHENH